MEKRMLGKQRTELAGRLSSAFVKAKKEEESTYVGMDDAHVYDDMPELEA
jgi:hypothetical protein